MKIILINSKGEKMNSKGELCQLKLCLDRMNPKHFCLDLTLIKARFPKAVRVMAEINNTQIDLAI